MHARAVAAMALLAASLAACGHDIVIDDAYLGNWSFIDSSGGITGRGDQNYRADRIELTPDHFNQFRDGEKISSQAIVYAERDCITGERRVAMCTDGSCFCLRLVDDDLHASQDAADGFSYHYRRPPLASP